MKLQTKLSHKKLTSITVNGNSYDIDSNCCIEVDDPADVKKLLSLGDEWTSNVAAMTRAGVSKIPIPGRPMRSAIEFVALLAEDTELAKKVAALRSFQSLSSLAFNLGFKFNENEFRDATSAFQKDAERAKAIDEQNEKKAKEKAGGDADTKKAKKQKAAKADVVQIATPPSDHKLSETLPETLPEEESGEWPDPSESFSVPYLKRMGAAYGVEFVGGTSKADMVAAITRGMYE